MPPSKGVATPADLDSFLSSVTCQHLVAFVQSLSTEAKGKPNQHYPKFGLVTWLDHASALVDDTPAQDKDHPSQRFGNRAFRTWHQQLCANGEGLVANAPIPDELLALWTRSFGDPTRLDFGTGHEVAFVMLMFCSLKQGFENLPHLALTVLPAYLALVRKLRLEYRLEPAGSHGVWSLDDYHFVPFIVGSAQMSAAGSELPSPKAARTPGLVHDLASQGYMYFEAIADVLRSKRGPFQEHSPMLFEIASLKSWDDVHAGLLRMWKAEVLGKFPVAQHFVFGTSLPISWQVSTEAIEAPPARPNPFASGGSTLDPLQRYFAGAASLNVAAGPAAPSGPEYTLLDGRGIEISQWRITTANSRISSELETEHVRSLNPELDFPLPEMFFGTNEVVFANAAFSLSFSAVNAVKGCKLKEDAPPDRKMFKLSISEQWAKRRDGEGKPIPTWRQDDFDWTFTTFYGGDASKPFTPTPRRINYEHLKQREPILFSAEVVLFEDDLFDTGVSRLSVKMRVMPTCFFCLCRYFLRVDNNFVRLVDNRFFHMFGTKYLLKEFTHREATFAELGEDVKSKDLVDSNVVASILPLVGEARTTEVGVVVV